MNFNSSGVKITNDQLKAIDEYEEYRRIVGEDDGGKLFTPEQYEAYKTKYIPLRRQNRIFVSWTNPNGVDCILPGPQSECFCQHRLIQHKTDFETVPTERPIPLPCKHCKCSSFHVMPKFGSQIARCHCKHYATDHSMSTTVFDHSYVVYYKNGIEFYHNCQSECWGIALFCEYSLEHKSCSNSSHILTLKQHVDLFTLQVKYSTSTMSTNKCIVRMEFENG
ncbi:unnamed protein product [Heterobilharzia americana]|nr:unnamed protein product [Heterobilharzia americana]